MEYQGQGQDPAAQDVRNAIRLHVVEVLVQKGFSKNRMVFNETFRLQTDEGELCIPVEIVVYVQGRPSLLVKCIDGNLAAREQASLALARLYPGGPVPFAVVANESDALVMDSETRKTIGFALSGIPGVSAVRSCLRAMQPSSPDDEKMEREKRILATYYHLRCPVPKDPF